MNRKIELNAAGRKALADHFGVAKGNVSLVLKFKRNSEQAKRMRQMAYELGGRLVEIVDITPISKAVKILDQRGNLKAVINQ